MRTLLTFIAVAFSIIGSVPASAQTPDGQTPAVETVCDPLIGASPGLYGLCVAYCEAHDAHILSPGGDPAELDVPNRHILQNYNKLKTESDPPMPCVQQGIESCPCWTTDQLSMVLPPIMNADANFEAACAQDDDSLHIAALIENMENGLYVSPYIQFSTGGVTHEFFCEVVNDGYLDEPPGHIHPVSDEELASCTALLIAHANVYQSAGIWDCFQ